MAKKGKYYFGMPWLLSVIFAIIPVTSWLFGFITRIKEGKIVAGILRIFLGWNIIWLLDLIFILFKKQIFRILNC